MPKTKAPPEEATAAASSSAGHDVDRGSTSSPAPRTEAPKGLSRVKTGLKEFNEVIDGLPMPSAILVEGPPGAGKSMFALSLMAGKGARVVVLTNNTPAEVRSEIATFGIGAEPEMVDCYSWLAGGKAAIDSLANLSKLTFLIEDALSEGAMLLLDSLTPLVLYNHEDEVERFLQQVIAIAKAKGSLLLLTLDSGTYHPDAEATVHSLCDGVIHLDPVKGMRILKMRDTEVPAKDFFYELGAKGFRLRSK